MASNIDTTLELNKLLAQQNELYAEQAKIMKGQVAMIRQMAEMLKQVDPRAYSGGWDEMNESMEAVRDNLSSVAGSGQQNLGELNEVLEDGVEGLMGMGKSLKSVGKGLIALAGPAAIIKTLGNALTIAGSVAAGVANSMLSVASAITNVGISIITAPFKMLRTLMDNVGSGSSELRQALEDVRQQFGDLGTGASKAIIDMSRGMKGQLAETGLSAYRIFGNLAERIKAIAEYAKQLGGMFNNLRDSFVANSEAVGAYIKGLGLTENGLKGVGRFALSTGSSFTEVGRQITSMAYGMGEAFGINGKEVSRAVGEMINDVKNFGSLSIKQLTSIAVFANKLGLEFQDLQGTIDQFDNFEQAAEAAAQLSQAFGLNVDALELIQEQDPAARFEQLRKAFFQTGRSVEQMTRQEMRLLAAQTGLSEEAVKLGFSLENQGVNYADVQKQADLTQKKQLTQAEAMQKLSNSIERMVKSGEALHGGFFEIFFKGFLKGITMSREFREMMRSLRQVMRITFQAGRQLGSAFVDFFPGIQDIFGGIRDFFNPGTWRTMMKRVVGAFTQFFKDITVNPQAGLQNLYKKLQEIFFDRFSASTPAGRRVLEGFATFYKTMFKVGVAAITLGLQFISRTISNAFTQGTAENDFVMGGMKMLQRLGQAIADYPWRERINELKNNLLDWFLSATDAIDWNEVAKGVTEMIYDSLAFSLRVLTELGPVIARAISEIDYNTAMQLLGAGLLAAVSFVLWNVLPGLLLEAGTVLVMDFLLPGLLTGLELAGSAIFAAIGGWPTLIVAGLVAIGLAILEWGDDLMDMVGSALDDLGPRLAAGIEEYAPMVLDAMMEFVMNLPSMIEEGMIWIGEAISSGIDWLITSVQNLFSASGRLDSSIKGFSERIGQAIGNVFAGFLQKHFPALWDGIVTTIGFFTNIQTEATNALRPILAWKSRYIDPVVRWLTTFADNVRGQFTSIVTSLPEPLQRFVGLVETGWNRIMTVMEPVMNRIREFLSIMMKAAGLSAFESVAPGLRGVVTALTDVQRAGQGVTAQTTQAVTSSGAAAEAQVRQMEETTRRIMEISAKASSGVTQAGVQVKAATPPAQKAASASPEATLDGIFGGGRGSPEAQRRAEALEQLSTLRAPSAARINRLERDVKYASERWTNGIATNIRDLVAAVNSVTTDLQKAGSDLPQINVQLKSLANNLGVGGSQRLEIKNRNFTIQMNVNVVLDADEFEQALSSRPGGSTFLLRDGGPGTNTT